MGNSASTQPQQPRVPSEPTKCVFHPQLYQGKWYELARYTNPFEKECESSTQTLKWDSQQNRMYITNECVTFDGNTIKIKGVGVPNQNHACQLTVNFKGIPKPGQYWVVWTDYDKWSLVSNENKTMFWMLGRSPYISKDDYMLLKVYAMHFGFDGNLIVPRKVIVPYKIESREKSSQQRRKEETIEESEIEQSCTDFNSDFRS